MAKTSQKPQIRFIPSLVLTSIVVAILVGNMSTFFGVHIPLNMANAIATPISYSLLIFALWLYFQRHSLDKNRLKRGLLVLVAFALFVSGWRFAAGEGLGTFQNDGYTVTGGFMMLVSGIIVGWLAGTDKTK